VTSLVYVYAVLPQPVATDVKGIDARPVRWVVDDRLAAAVSDVPAEDFDEAPLNEHVRDMSWLAPRAVAHQEVNARLHEYGEAIVPLAFGTVFRDDEGIKRLLRDQRPALGARLQAVRDCGEWVLSLHLLQEPDAELVAMASPALQALRQEIATSTPGRAHLLQRRLAEVERQERRRIQSESGDQVIARLREIVSDVYLEPLPSDTVERPLVRASLLVSRAAEPRLLEEVERLQAQWPEPVYRLQLSGPWPPYRFGGLQPEHGSQVAQSEHAEHA
jgi:hypothetical protein